MNELQTKYKLSEYEKDFKADDIKGDTPDQRIWKEFAEKFGSSPYLWLCKRVNGERVYIPEIDSQLKPARLRAYPVDNPLF